MANLTVRETNVSIVLAQSAINRPDRRITDGIDGWVLTLICCVCREPAIAIGTNAYLPCVHSNRIYSDGSHGGIVDSYAKENGLYEAGKPEGQEDT